MADRADGAEPVLRRWWRRLPDRLDRRVVVAAWASFAVQVLLVATGGAVRLTSSGLGCPTWPLCTADSLVSTPEMGIHGLIEFGNRTLAGVVGVAAVVVLLLVVRVRHERRDLALLAGTVVLGVVAQALVGGVTVLTGLNPFVVGFHYVASVALACVCAAFLVRLRVVPADGGSGRAPAAFRVATVVLVTTAVVTILLGVLTTGAGPHSGDAQAGRNGFDATLLQHVHAWPSYVLVAVTAALTVVAWARRMPVRAWLLALLALEGVQVLLGLYQARHGLPVLAVGAHMVLATLLAAATTVVALCVAGYGPARSLHVPARSEGVRRGARGSVR
ncbi:COX15/CtaA family protein [Cellulosimicrobium protaetiae]|uniref:COX15/CtaA family protein n=1 Tax=Cellulosimicrobium protaetiae TaxID=2587808 RepID=UPI0020A34104|nr:COX15/CtaA family protein [Cellulosimicrobium protaetiae]